MTIKRTERGWAGHFIASTHCKFRRNTLVESGDKRFVISTVGNYMPNGVRKIIGLNRLHETMVFEAKFDGLYWDADVTKEVFVNSNWAIGDPNADDNEINDMHETIVNEIIEKSQRNEKL